MNELLPPFLAHCLPAHRGAIGNLFYAALRACGLLRNPRGRTPEAVCDSVLKELAGKRVAKGGVNWELVAGVLVEYREEAVAFAALCQEREREPAAEKARRKQETARTGQRAWMATQTPTPPQLAFLAKLGHTGEAPANRLEASDLIEALKGGK